MIFDVQDRFKNINKIYSVSNVTNGFYYWYWKLFNIQLDMFQWDNTPDSLPSREIEIQLLLTGHTDELEQILENGIYIYEE